MKENFNNYLRKKENFVLNNLSIISVLIIGINFLLYYNQFISIEFCMSSLGAIIVFWYGYKKYEKDKDIEMIDKYLLGNLTIQNINELEKWRVGYYLYNKGYISNWIWKIIDSHNSFIFIKFLHSNLTSDNIDEKYFSKLHYIYSEEGEFAQYIKYIILNVKNGTDNILFEKKLPIDGKKQLKIFKKNLKMLIDIFEGNIK